MSYLGSGFVLTERCLGFGNRLGDRHDAVEPCRVEQTRECGSAARNDDFALVFAGAADTADECAEAR